MPTAPNDRSGPTREIVDGLGIEHELDAPLAPRTWYGLGGCAQVLAHPDGIHQLSALAAACHETGVAVRVLGSGANLLVLDDGVDGIVVTLDKPSFRQVDIDRHIVTAGAGYELPKLVTQTVKAGLAGLEPLTGIPATIGGAIRTNAGGAYGDIGQTVRRVQLMDATGQTYYRDRDDLVFAYRRTNIVAPLILEARFELTEHDPEALMKRVKKIFLYKKTTQPLTERSAGCVFKNPKPPPDGPGGAAGELIDRAGLKGFRIGGAEVSERHANFIIAHGGCTASNILAVIEHVEEVVLKRHSVTLERELVVWK